MNPREQLRINEKKLEIINKQKDNKQKQIALSSELELDLTNPSLQRRMKQLEEQSKELDRQAKELG